MMTATATKRTGSRSHTTSKRARAATGGRSSLAATPATPPKPIINPEAAPLFHRLEVDKCAQRASRAVDIAHRVLEMSEGEDLEAELTMIATATLERADEALVDLRRMLFGEPAASASQQQTEEASKASPADPMSNALRLIADLPADRRGLIVTGECESNEAVTEGWLWSALMQSLTEISNARPRPPVDAFARAVCDLVRAVPVATE